MSTIAKKLKELIDRNRRGNSLSLRESDTIEFKKSFSLGNLAEYITIMASFANKKGGYLVFGITDSPRKIIGIDRQKFDNLEQEKVTNLLLEYFDPEIRWETGLVTINSKTIGFLYTYESDTKPIICRKNYGNILKSGEIYFRYRAQTRLIRYPELKKIIDNIREKQDREWINTLSKIARIGPKAELVPRNRIKVTPSNIPNAVPVRLDDLEIKKLYPWTYYELVKNLKKRYRDFRQNQKFYNIKKELEENESYCYVRKLDPDNPKSQIKKFYNPKILKEFDKYYKKGNHEPQRSHNN